MLRVALPVMLALAFVPHAEGKEPVARFGGTSFPTPPRQNDAWKPPACEVPESYRKAAALLFDIGLADPRGCEYRAVRVMVRLDIREDSDIASTHAWVLPAEDRDRQRFAVCWDGLVYPIVSVGEKADLKKDVLSALMPRDEQERWAIEMDRAPAIEKEIAKTGLFLLLRLGEARLADAVYLAQSRPQEEKTEPSEDEVRKNVINSLTQHLMDVGETAHQQRDDRLALLRLRHLDRALKELKKRGLDKDEERAGMMPVFTALLADQERRQKARPREPVVCLGPGRHADQQKRIAGLIDRLDEIAGLDDDPHSSDLLRQALRDEGTAAVEPLLQCMEKDNRLTRIHKSALGGLGGGHCWPPYVGAAEIAEGVLRNMIEAQGHYLPYLVDRPEEREEEQRKKRADNLRALFRKIDGMTPEDRWLRLLADDRANPVHWRWAADRITSRELAGPRARGLRERKAPSVSELLRKRLAQASKAYEVNVSKAHEVSELANALADWDGKSALPVIREVSTLLAADEYVFRSLLSVRMKLEDPELFDDYTPWLLKRSPATSSFCLDPLIQLPRHPGARKCARALFGDVASPWRRAFTGDEKDATRIVEKLLESNLVVCEPFRDFILELLTRKEVLGTAELNNVSGGLKWTGPQGEGENRGYRDPLMPEGKFQVEYRLCDLVAYKLADRMDVAPRCELYWPLRKREAAVKACIEFLKRHDDLDFPKRQRPASAEDVARGRAIFSLTGPGKQVRQVNLPLPLWARWKTLEDHPFDEEVTYWQSGKTERNKGFRQGGTVVQAEEVFEGGRWKRYYGFAGVHRLARVPAEEIEFPDLSSYRSNSLSVQATREFDMRIEPPGTKPADAGYTFEPPPRHAAGAPIRFQVTLTNRSGLDAEVPPADKLPRLKLGYSPETITPLGYLAPAAGKDGWSAVRPLPGGASLSFPKKGPMLPVTESKGELIDLCKLFDLSRAGFYRLTLEPVDGKAVTQTDGVIFSVAPAEKKP